MQRLICCGTSEETSTILETLPGSKPTSASSAIGSTGKEAVEVSSGFSGNEGVERRDGGEGASGLGASPIPSGDSTSSLTTSIPTNDSENALQITHRKKARVGIIGTMRTGRNTLACRLIGQSRVDRFCKRQNENMMVAVIPTNSADPDDTDEPCWTPKFLQSLDVIILMFAVFHIDSLIELAEIWAVIMKKTHPTKPRFFVLGNKLDIKTDIIFRKNVRFLPDSDMRSSVSTFLDTDQYLECSVLTKEGVDNVQHAIFKISHPSLFTRLTSLFTLHKIPHPSVFTRFSSLFTLPKISHPSLFTLHKISHFIKQFLHRNDPFVVGVLGTRGCGRNTFAARLCQCTDELPSYSRTHPIHFEGKYQYKMTVLVIPTHEEDLGGPVEDWWKEVPQMNVVILIYAVNDNQSILNALWTFEDKLRNTPSNQIIPPKLFLVGNKIDLPAYRRYQKHYSPAVFEAFQWEIPRFECSARNNTNIDQIRNTVAEYRREPRY